MGSLYRVLRSPLEYDSTPIITQLMQVPRPSLQPVAWLEHRGWPHSLWDNTKLGVLAIVDLHLHRSTVLKCAGMCNLGSAACGKPERVPEQEYLVKLLGRYREYVAPDAHADHYEGGPGSRPEPDACMRYLAMPLCWSLLMACSPAPPTLEEQPVLFAVAMLVMRRVLRACRAHGWRFDHAAFVASFRSARTRAFLAHLRESQCYEVFVNERLRMASLQYADIDAFEAKVPLLVCGTSTERPCAAS